MDTVRSAWGTDHVLGVFGFDEVGPVFSFAGRAPF